MAGWPMLPLATKPLQLTKRERECCELLIQGCENQEIGEAMHMARRTVKAVLNRIFIRNGIEGGLKRVKLAVLYYREQRAAEKTL